MRTVYCKLLLKYTIYSYYELDRDKSKKIKRTMG